MQVSVESTSALERRMTIGVPAERIETEVDKRLQQTARRAKVPGFRPGKVPMSVIRQRYEAAARQEALGDLIQATFYEAVVEQKLNPAGAPAVEPKVFEKGKDLEYVATFEVFPEIKLAGFDNIAVERLQAEVTDADIDNMIEVLRKQNTRFESVERAAAEWRPAEHRLRRSSIDGEIFAGGSAKGTPLVLGSGRMIPGFEDGSGRCQDWRRARDRSVTFPEDYQNLDLAGKTAEFTVTVNNVGDADPAGTERRLLRPVRRQGRRSGSLPRRSCARTCARELRQAIKTKVKNQVMEGLLANNTVEVPKATARQRSEPSARAGRSAVRRQHQARATAGRACSKSRPSVAWCWG